jgi:hypothetical protein
MGNRSGHLVLTNNSIGCFGGEIFHFSTISHQSVSKKIKTDDFGVGFFSLVSVFT